MGLGNGQDLCVGRSHLCRIAEVEPNDPGPRARRHHLTLRAGVLVPGFQRRRERRRRSASLHRACISIMERKVPVGKVSPGR